MLKYKKKMKKKKQIIPMMKTIILIYQWKENIFKKLKKI